MPVPRRSEGRSRRRSQQPDPALEPTSADVEIRRSARRQRTVTAYREDGRTIVIVPARMSRADVDRYVAELVARIDRSEHRARRSDTELMSRAQQLSRRYLDDNAKPLSVRWVDNQRKRWGSATPADGSIRLSSRLSSMPAYVIDYVLLHELAHFIVPGHGPKFDVLLADYSELPRAQAFLAGVSHGDQHGREPIDAGAGDDHGTTDITAANPTPVATQPRAVESDELALFD